MRSAGKRGEQGREGPARSLLPSLTTYNTGRETAGEGARQSLESNLESSVSGERERSLPAAAGKSSQMTTGKQPVHLAAWRWETQGVETQGHGPRLVPGAREGGRGDSSLCGARGGTEGPESKRGGGKNTQRRSSRVHRPLHRRFTSPPAEAPEWLSLCLLCK